MIRDARDFERRRLNDDDRNDGDELGDRIAATRGAVQAAVCVVTPLRRRTRFPRSIAVQALRDNRACATLAAPGRCSAAREGEPLHYEEARDDARRDWPHV